MTAWLSLPSWLVSLWQNTAKPIGATKKCNTRRSRCKPSSKACLYPVDRFGCRIVNVLLWRRLVCRIGWFGDLKARGTGGFAICIRNLTVFSVVVILVIAVVFFVCFVILHSPAIAIWLMLTSASPCIAFFCCTYRLRRVLHFGFAVCFCISASPCATARLRRPVP